MAHPPCNNAPTLQHSFRSINVRETFRTLPHLRSTGGRHSGGAHQGQKNGGSSPFAGWRPGNRQNGVSPRYFSGAGTEGIYRSAGREMVETRVNVRGSFLPDFGVVTEKARG